MLIIKDGMGKVKNLINILIFYYIKENIEMGKEMDM